MNAEEQKSIEEQKKLEEQNKAGERAYLRDEIKQILSFSYEHSQNTIKMVLGIWAGLSVVLGWVKFYELEYLPISLHLLILVSCMTIFFISVWILYFSIRKIRGNVESLFKIAAYIMVFHEGKSIKNCNNFCWETAQFETDILAGEKNVKLFNENNSETMYKVFMIFSIIGIVISPIIFFELSEFQKIISKICSLEIIVKVIYFLYIGISLCLFCKSLIPLNGDFNYRKQKHIDRFEEIKSRSQHS